MPEPDDIAKLEIQLRMAQNMAAAAESGLFPTSALRRANLKSEVERLERRISELRKLRPTASDDH